MECHEDLYLVATMVSFRLALVCVPPWVAVHFHGWIRLLAKIRTERSVETGQWLAAFCNHANFAVTRRWFFPAFSAHQHPCVGRL